MIASILTTREKKISKSIPSTWAYPLNTSLALFLVTYPYAFILFLNTHFIPITFLSLGLGTSSHVSFFFIWFSSSSMALIQCSSILDSSNLLNSIVDNNEKIPCYGVDSCILLLVSISTLLFPMICSGGWCLWYQLLGVLEGVRKPC